MTRSRKGHALNLFIEYDLKKSIQEAAEACDCSLSDLVRFLLRIGLPIVRGIRESRELLLTEQVQMFRDRNGLQEE